MKYKVPMLINVRLYKNGKLVCNTTKRYKTKVAPFVRCNVAPERKFDKGVCTVYYDKANDEWNKFEFKGYEDFLIKYAPCVDKALLDYMAMK